MNNIISNLKLAGSALALACVLASPVAANEADAPSADQSQGGLQDIVVTARKRSESVQDVPVAVTALSAEQIAQKDLTNLEKVAASTPNFSVGRASNGSGATLTLRGIGSSATSIGIEQSVAVVVDGVYYGQGRVINEGFFDLARLEILKGPQALFFGKNATAGVVSITTADPTPDWEFKVRTAYEFRSEQAQVEAIASGPLSDTLGIRVAVRGSKMWGGYFKNVADPVTLNTLDIATGTLTPHIARPAPRDQPGEKELLGRVTLKWTPDERLTATLKLSGTRSETNNSSWNYVPFNCATGSSSLNPAVPCKESFVTHQNAIPVDIAANLPFSKDDGSLYNRYRSFAVTGAINYELDDVTISSVTNYQENRNSWSCACDFQSSNRGTWATENAKWRAVSSELRALTSYDGPVNLMVGGLYQKTKRVFDQWVLTAGATGFAVENSLAAPANRYVTFQKNSETEGETLAGFGQVMWKLVDTLEATAGVRYTHETKDSYFVQPYVNAAYAGVFTPNTFANANQSFNNWSPEATLTWKPQQGLMVYAAYKTAYKSGGFSNSGIYSAFSPNPIEDFTFKPEKAKGFEVGAKTTLLDNQLRFNVGLYSFKFTDLQVDFFNSQIFAFQTYNAGAARSKGVEVEFEYAPRAIDGLSIQGSVNYNKATYKNFIAPCFSGQKSSEGCNLPSAGNNPLGGAPFQDLSGKPTANAPQWTASLGTRYETPIGSNLKFGLSADARYSDSYIVSGFGNPYSQIGSYVQLDAGVRIGSEDDRWEVAVIGKNLTNRFYVSGMADGPSTGSGSGTAGGVHADVVGFAALPRTVQIQFTGRF
ncbi:TonB-dependent receptor [Sphingobium terrigena]|uniref:TonB-dependent receptor n=1 Tax=Sphingobium terrigena TaxID=2304063 RepID=A0A418YN33_9SPHN|nr:TonB-dependent receptor [Sphingobium terrigena]RJG52590.1 TonB-dependent receptor [Sphingobium terrigena]